MLRHTLLRMAFAAVALGALGLMAGCEEDTSPQIDKFVLSPDCDVISVHTQARLDEDGNPVLDGDGHAIIDTVGIFMEVEAFARASGGNPKKDPTGANSPLDWEWSFGDGGTATNEVVVRHRYEAAGEFTVTLTVTDDDGDTDSRSGTVIVGAEGETVDVLLVEAEQTSDPSPHRGRVAADARGEVRVLDIADPADPVLLGRWSAPRLSGRLESFGNYAYLFDDATSSGIIVLDMSDSAAPDSVGVAAALGDIADFQSDGSHLYVAGGFSGLQVFDLADPTDPVNVALVGGIDFVTSIALDGDRLYLTAGRDEGARLQVYDITDPSDPILLGGTTSPLLGMVLETELVGDHLYIAGGLNGFVVADVGNEAAPAILTSVPSGDVVISVVMDGTLAYVLNLTGIEIFDVFDPAQPISLGSATSSASPYPLDLDHRDGILYVTGAESGVELFDVSDPVEPVHVDVLERLGYSRTVTVEGSRAYVLEFGELQGFDVDFRGELSTPCPVTGLAEQYEWLWQWGDGTESLHVGEPTHTFPSLPDPSDYEVILRVTETATTVTRSDTLEVTVPSREGLD